MTNTEQVEQDTQQAAEEALSNGEDLQQRVRDITLKALTERTLDTENIKAVIQAVSQGIVNAVGDNKQQMQQSFKQASKGMDDALSKSAEAAKLAAQEAIGKAHEFSENEFKQTLDQLENLESIFIDTISKTAEVASQASKETLETLASHLKTSGTDAGKTATEALKTLSDDMAKLGKDSLSNSIDAGQKMRRQISDIASGILSGMASALKSKD